MDLPENSHDAAVVIFFRYYDFYDIGAVTCDHIYAVEVRNYWKLSKATVEYIRRGGECL